MAKEAKNNEPALEYLAKSKTAIHIINMVILVKAYLITSNNYNIFTK